MASELIVQTLKGLTSGANANKVIIPAGQTLDASAGSVVLPAGVGGKVLNVYQDLNQASTNTTTSSTSFIASALSITLTPTSASSKFLLFTSMTMGAGSEAAIATFYRDSTNLGKSDNGFGGTGYTGGRGNVAISYLDSPATTSSITYAVYWRSRAGGTVELPPWGEHQTLIIQEIAG